MRIKVRRRDIQRRERICKVLRSGATAARTVHASLDLGEKGQHVLFDIGAEALQSRGAHRVVAHYCESSADGAEELSLGEDGVLGRRLGRGRHGLRVMQEVGVWAGGGGFHVC